MNPHTKASRGRSKAGPTPKPVSLPYSRCAGSVREPGPVSGAHTRRSTSIGSCTPSGGAAGDQLSTGVTTCTRQGMGIGAKAPSTSTSAGSRPVSSSASRRAVCTSSRSVASRPPPGRENCPGCERSAWPRSSSTSAASSRPVPAMWISTALRRTSPSGSCGARGSGCGSTSTSPRRARSASGARKPAPAGRSGASAPAARRCRSLMPPPPADTGPRARTARSGEPGRCTRAGRGGSAAGPGS